MTYYYGGNIAGRVIEPVGNTRPARVQITNSIPDAALLALSEKGFVCEVRPVGKVVDDANGEAGIHFVCKRAKVVRILSWSEVRAHIKIRIVDEQQAQGKKESVRDEGEI